MLLAQIASKVRELNVGSGVRATAHDRQLVIEAGAHGVGMLEATSYPFAAQSAAPAVALEDLLIGEPLIPRRTNRRTTPASRVPAGLPATDRDARFAEPANVCGARWKLDATLTACPSADPAASTHLCVVRSAQWLRCAKRDLAAARYRARAGDAVPRRPREAARSEVSLVVGPAVPARYRVRVAPVGATSGQRPVVHKRATNQAQLSPMSLAPATAVMLPPASFGCANQVLAATSCGVPYALEVRVVALAEKLAYDFAFAFVDATWPAVRSGAVDRLVRPHIACEAPPLVVGMAPSAAKSTRSWAAIHAARTILHIGSFERGPVTPGGVASARRGFTFRMEFYRVRPKSDRKGVG